MAFVKEEKWGGGDLLSNWKMELMSTLLSFSAFELREFPFQLAQRERTTQVEWVQIIASVYLGGTSVVTWRDLTYCSSGPAVLWSRTA
jgi:hypothetical protein